MKMYHYLTERYAMCDAFKQVQRSGTSIGANVREGSQAQSKLDFIHKMSIALKEASETEYWLNLLHEAGYINKTQKESMHNDCVELIKMLTAIIKTSKINPDKRG